MVDAVPITVSLKQRVLGASFWSVAGFAVSNAIRLGSSLVMTRLLVPEMFGVMAIAMMIMTGLAMFSDLGLKANIIQSRRGDNAAFLNTAWAIQIARGLLIWLLAVCISLLVFAANRLGVVPKGSVYADPSLPYVIAIASLSVPIGAFQSTKFSEASRHISLGRVTQIQIAAQIVGLISMIGWALLDRSIWALVAGGICSAIIRALLTHIWLPGVANRWQWDWLAFHEIVHFAKWIFLSSTLTFLASNADRMLLGGLIDSSMLGVYSIAITIVSIVSQILNRIIIDVGYSALSEVARERSVELRRNYYKLHMVTASFTYFCAGALIVSGNTLIRLLYDPRYEQAGWMLQVLAFVLLAAPFNLARFSLLALGLPKIFTGIMAIQGGGSIVLIPLGFHFLGIPGALWAIVASQLSIVPAVIYYQLKYDLFDLSKELLLFSTLFAGMILARGFTLLVGLQ